MTGSNSTCAQFGIDFDYDIGTVLISLHGELDARSVPAFDGALRALADHGTRSVTIDLSALRFCNVSGLRVMAELAARMNAIDGHVEIRAPAILTRMLEVTALHSLFVISDPTADIDSTAEPRVSAAAPRSARAARAARTSRPRAGSRHRLSTET